MLVSRQITRSTKKGQPQCANTCGPLPASNLLCPIGESKSYGGGQMQCRRELFQGMETERHVQIVGHSCSNLPYWLHSRYTTDIGYSSFCNSSPVIIKTTWSCSPEIFFHSWYCHKYGMTMAEWISALSDPNHTAVALSQNKGFGL